MIKGVDANKPIICMQFRLTNFKDILLKPILLIHRQCVAYTSQFLPSDAEDKQNLSVILSIVAATLRLDCGYFWVST